MAISIKGLFAEACRAPSSNPKLALLVFAACLVPQLLLYLVELALTTLVFAEQIARITANVAALVASPQTADRDELIRQVMEDAKGLVIFLVAALIVMIVIAALQYIVVVYWADTARLQKQVAPKDFVSKVGKAFKRTIITVLLIEALWLCYAVVLGCVFAVVVIAIFNSSSLLLGLIFLAAAILALASVVFGVVVTNLAAVISVVEDGCYGFGAIGKAWEVLKGRRMQGCLLVLAIFGVNLLIYVLRGWLSSILGEGMFFSLLLGLVWLCLTQVVAILNMSVFTMFYRDCQESRGEFAGSELHYDELSTEV